MQAGRLALDRPVTRAFGSRKALERFLAPATVSAPRAVAQIDFATHEAVLTAAGARSSTGYGVEVLDVREERGRVVVRVRERAPRLGDPVAARVTYPYRLLVLPRRDKPVHVVWDGRS